MAMGLRRGGSIRMGIKGKDNTREGSRTFQEASCLLQHSVPEG